jgi:hypothetical protein
MAMILISATYKNHDFFIYRYKIGYSIETSLFLARSEVESKKLSRYTNGYLIDRLTEERHTGNEVSPQTPLYLWVNCSCL